MKLISGRSLLHTQSTQSHSSLPKIDENGYLMELTDDEDLEKSLLRTRSCLSDSSPSENESSELAKETTDDENSVGGYTGIFPPLENKPDNPRRHRV
uniref:Uncharacterized protein n=2 Tax=Caenorhabditis japonica TaxID=281687 RepID=A0A8R1E8K6_CAEJA